MKRLLVLVSLAALLVLALGSVAHAAAVGKSTGQSRADVLHYWTDARMKDARPVERAAKANAGKPGPSSRPIPSRRLRRVRPTRRSRRTRTARSTSPKAAPTTSARARRWTARTRASLDGRPLRQRRAGRFYTNWMFVPAYLNGRRALRPVHRIAAPIHARLGGFGRLPLRPRRSGRRGPRAERAEADCRPRRRPRSEHRRVGADEYTLYGYPQAASRSTARRSAAAVAVTASSIPIRRPPSDRRGLQHDRRIQRRRLADAAGAVASVDSSATRRQERHVRSAAGTGGG